MNASLLAAATAVSITALLAAGCGSSPPPRFAHRETEPLIGLANRIETEGPCAQRRDIAELRRRVTLLANSARVDTELLEPLSSAVNLLASEVRACS